MLIRKEIRVSDSEECLLSYSINNQSIPSVFVPVRQNSVFRIITQYFYLKIDPKFQIRPRCLCLIGSVFLKGASFSDVDVLLYSRQNLLPIMIQDSMSSSHWWYLRFYSYRDVPLGWFTYSSGSYLHNRYATNRHYLYSFRIFCP